MSPPEPDPVPTSAAPTAHGSRRAGRVLLPKGWQWDRAVAGEIRDGVATRILLLPAWVDGQLEAQNLDVKKIEGSDGLYRLRVGDVRAIFQILGREVVVHRVAPRSKAYDRLETLVLVRSGRGLRPLSTEPPAPPAPATRMRPPVQSRASFELVANPLSAFSDGELLQAGLPREAVEVVRRFPSELHPDEALAALDIEPGLVRLVAELWEQPGHYLERLAAGATLDLELVRLEDEEASARIEADLSSMSLLSVSEAAQFVALLDRSIEDWMVYLHPEQLRAVRLSPDGPARVRGGAGTGKTVVALHRARRLALTLDARVLLTTFISTLPKVWGGLFAAFAPSVRARIDMRTVDSLALGIYRESGGTRTPMEQDQRSKIVSDLWWSVHRELRGLSSLGLEEEFDFVLTGRGVGSLEEYQALPRTGRGSPLATATRVIVWELYGRYLETLRAENVIGWHELRREALTLLRDGTVRREYAAVVVDEAQDLTESGMQLLVELAGGLPRPRLTIVGDGQQSIYPGGFSLLSLGIDVRGRAVVLDVNWRNTYAIWMAAQAFTAGERFDDLEEDDAVLRGEAETALPIRYGSPARLHVVDGGADEEAEWIAMLLAEDIERGADPGDCAVVHPFNKGAARIESALKRAGVAVAPLSAYQGKHRANVWVGTFHRIKGLEFKRVYVAGLGAGQWPYLKRDLDAVAHDEERRRQVRAAFVALTRARDSLDVIVGGQPAEQLARARWAFDE